jgi:hypothetical protein
MNNLNTSRYLRLKFSILLKKYFVIHTIIFITSPPTPEINFETVLLPLTPTAASASLNLLRKKTSVLFLAQLDPGPPLSSISAFLIGSPFGCTAHWTCLGHNSKRSPPPLNAHFHIIHIHNFLVRKFPYVQEKFNTYLKFYSNSNYLLFQ